MGFRKGDLEWNGCLSEAVWVLGVNVFDGDFHYDGAEGFGYVFERLIKMS